MRYIFGLACLVVCACGEDTQKPALKDNVGELKAQISANLQSNLILKDGVVFVQPDADVLASYAAFPVSANWHVECDFSGVSLGVERYAVGLTDGIHDEDTCEQLVPFAVVKVQSFLAGRR